MSARMRNVFTRIGHGAGRKVVAVVASLMMVTGLAVTVGAAPAQAYGYSWLSRNDGGNVFVSSQFAGGWGALVRSGTSFDQSCYRDGPWTNAFGNYWTNRYFYGVAHTTRGDYWGWVTASVVANQQWVPACW